MYNRKMKNGGYQHLLLFPGCFQKAFLCLETRDYPLVLSVCEYISISRITVLFLFFCYSEKSMKCFEYGHIGSVMS